MATTQALLPQDGKFGASRLSTVVGVMNNIIGAGYVSLAYSLAQTSMVTGLVMMSVAGVLGIISAVFIAAVCQQSGRFDFTSLGGPGLAKFSLIACTLYAIGSCISYVVLLADYAHKVTPTCPRSLISTVLALFVLLPISLPVNLKSLAGVSAVGLVCVLYTTGVVIMKDKEPGEAVGEQIWEIPPIGSMSVAWPLLSVAFTCHYNIPRFYAEFVVPDLRTFSRVVVVSFLLTFVLYGVTAAAGYDTFGVNTKGNLMLCYSEGDWHIEVAQLSLSILTVATYPLVMNFVRRGVLTLMQVDQTSLTFWSGHLPITLALVTLTLVVAICVPRIEVVLGFKGAIFGSAIVYIVPGLAYWRVVGGSSGLVFAAFGVVTCLLGTYHTTLNLLHA